MIQQQDPTFTIRTRRWLVPAALALGLFVSLATFFATGFHALVAVPALFLPLAVRLARGELQLLPDGLRLRDSFGQRDFAFCDLARVEDRPNLPPAHPVDDEGTGFGHKLVLHFHDGREVPFDLGAEAAEHLAARISNRLAVAPPSRASDFARSDDGRGKSAEEVRAPFREAQLTSEDLSEIVEHPTLPVRVRVRALEELVRVAPTAREELARRLGASVHRKLREALDDVADTPSSDRFTRTSAR